jgi:hypothetical protein
MYSGKVIDACLPSVLVPAFVEPDLGGDIAITAAANDIFRAAVSITETMECNDARP